MEPIEATMKVPQESRVMQDTSTKLFGELLDSDVLTVEKCKGGCNSLPNVEIHQGTKPNAEERTPDPGTKEYWIQKEKALQLLRRGNQSDQQKPDNVGEDDGQNTKPEGLYGKPKPKPGMQK
jgi:hypothetical protein